MTTNKEFIVECKIYCKENNLLKIINALNKKFKCNWFTVKIIT